jgi:VWFA-related protein
MVRQSLISMAGARNANRWKFGLASITFAVLALFVAPDGAQQTSNAPSQDANPPGFRLRVSSSLVLVPVVVRDATGQPVSGLRKEDFKVFDRGQEQQIGQFEVESLTPAQPLTTTPASTGSANAASSSTVANTQPRYLAFYFDNLHVSVTDLQTARDAAVRFFASSLGPTDHVAIVTPEATVVDFTSDTVLIRDALRKLQVSSHARNKDIDCPKLSDYQASQIAEFPDNLNLDSWILARDEAANCLGIAIAPNGSSSGLILGQARAIVSQNDVLTRASLEGIDRLVQHLAQVPSGRRGIVLVSPGFLTMAQQFQIDRVIDRALRAQVIVDSLDPKGLPILLRTDAASAYVPKHGAAASAARNVDSTAEKLQIGVLDDIAQGTGGSFFYRNNDLQAGFAALTGAQVSYLLGFAPNDVKANGTFHPLKIILVPERKGMTVQARRGYFAPRQGSKDDNAGDQANQALAPPTSREDEAWHAKVQELLLAKTENAELSVDLNSTISADASEKRGLKVSAHVDTRTLRFDKEADRNTNTVIAVVGVFDSTDHLLQAQQRQAKISATDDELKGVTRKGIDFEFAFQLPAGSYRIRAVVTESRQHLVTATSHPIQIR